MAGRERFTRHQQGAAAVEFALVGSLLIVLVLGIISYGFMLTFRQAMSQGAAEGARAAVTGAVFATEGPDAVSALNEALDSYGVRCGLTGVGTGNLLNRSNQDVGQCIIAVAECVNDDDHECASVTVAYEYADNPLVPSFPGLGLVLPNTLEYTAVARVS